MLHTQGKPDEALELLGRVAGSFAADGLGARIRLEQAQEPDLSEAFEALDQGDRERGLDLLLAALQTADGSRDEVRQVIVGVLEELGVEHPLARESRRRLAAVLY